MFLFKEWLLNEETHNFSCVMVPLTKVSSKVAQWSSKHIPSSKLYTPEGGRDEDTHTTALYGLHTNTAKDVEPTLDKFKPFDVRLGKVSKFEAGKYDVLKIEVSSDVLVKMNAALKKLPYTSKFPKYVPHCTIAYVKPGSCDKLVGNRDFDGMKIHVEDIIFSSASGKKTTFKLNKS